MAESSSQKRDSKGLVSCLTRSKLPRGTLSHSKNIIDPGDGMLVPPQLSGSVQVCKYFLDAVEKKQYDWFWVCPNGGKDCHYMHALLPGYILKSQMKALLDEESEKIAIEDEIENHVTLIFFMFSLPLYFPLL